MRRYVHGGLLRGKRRGRREVSLPYSEERYLQRHWGLLSGLRGALRTEHSVRLAVLFGSTATGDDRPDSDIDLLVAHSSGDPEDIVELRRRLQERIGRPVHLTLLENAERSPSLLTDVLLEGRTIVDRDEIWPRLDRRRGRALREAATEAEAARTAARRGISAARSRLAR